MSVTPLGAGQEVGRSCHVIEFRGMTIMLDQEDVIKIADRLGITIVSINAEESRLRVAS